MEDDLSSNLTKELFRQFSKRIMKTLLVFSIDVFDKTIESNVKT